VAREIAIGETKPGDRTAEAAEVELLHPEARRDRQAGEMRAHRGAFHPDCAGRQGGKARLTLAADADRADDGAVGENAARAGGAFEARIGEQLADHEGAGLLRPEIFGDSG
jgi:hypothetical protein